MEPVRPQGKPRLPVRFLGIGAQRAASTWLANSLRQHPQVWMPPRKEIHYFSRATKYPTASFLNKQRSAVDAVAATLSGGWVGGRIRRDVRATIARKSVRDLRWLWDYYVSDPDDEWYLSLFRPRGELAYGEVTPDYSVIDRDDVDAAARVLPGARLLFVMRHPVERTWSQVRLASSRGMVNLDDAKAVTRFIDSPAVRLRSDYLRTVRNWRNGFGDDSILISTVDEIERNPEQVLAQIGSHLGIDKDRFGTRSPTNQAPARDIDAAVARHIAAAAIPMLSALTAELDDASVVRSWIADCERLAE